VSWQRAIATVILIVLAGFPAGATVCAMVCHSETRQVTAHHGLDHNCEEFAPSAGPRLSDASQHDCTTHDPGVRQPATAPGERSHVTASCLSPVPITSHGEFGVDVTVHPRIQCSSPPGTAPGTTTRTVLRV
jgi:hypothetical protein